DDNVIGTTTRGQAHADPSLIHRSVAILVFRDGKVFLQKRSPTKDRYANYWACSATGHVDSGETYDQAAVRELKEELGLTVKDPPIAMTTQLMEYDKETELMRFYCYETNDDIVTHPVEISDGKFVDLAKPFPDDMPVTPCTEFIRTYLLERGAIR
ncbi:MAG TPA: NUDIX domain-containing protein, partial [Candidatus Peribacteria bacterium]|nr:NUDIX domain-containing protein [Candidatus Peribacteria bacterium]